MNPISILSILLFALMLFFHTSSRAQNQNDSLISIKIQAHDSLALYDAPYDSINVTLDSLRDIDGELTRQRLTADYYKKVNGALTIVKSRVCLTQWWDSERSDCSIYYFKDGVLVNDEYIQGDE